MASLGAVLTSLAVNSVGFAVLIGTGKARTVLTPAGCAHGYILGNLLWICEGWRGWSTGFLFLVLGEHGLQQSKTLARG